MWLAVCFISRGFFALSDCVNGRASALFRDSVKASFTFTVSGSAFDLSQRLGVQTQPFRHLLRHRQDQRLPSRQVNV